MPVSGPGQLQLRALVSNLRELATPEARFKINRAMAGEALSLVREGFDTSRDPYGKAWKQPVLRDGQPLVASGRLRAGWKARADPRGFTLENAVPYAKVQQDGAHIVPKNGPYLKFKSPKGWMTLKEVTIPAHKMLPDEGLPEKWEKRMVGAADQVLRKMVLGGR